MNNFTILNSWSTTIIDSSTATFNIIESILPYMGFFMLFTFMIKIVSSVLNWYSPFEFKEETVWKWNELLNEIEKNQIEKDKITDNIRNLRIKFIKDTNLKIKNLETTVKNRFNDLWEEYFLLRKSIKLKSESDNIQKILQEKKYSNINKLTSLIKR